MKFNEISSNVVLQNRSGSKIETTKTLAGLSGRISHGDSGELGTEDTDDW